MSQPDLRCRIEGSPPNLPLHQTSAACSGKAIVFVCGLAIRSDLTRRRSQVSGQFGGRAFVARLAPADTSTVSYPPPAPWDDKCFPDIGSGSRMRCCSARSSGGGRPSVA